MEGVEQVKHVEEVKQVYEKEKTSKALFHVTKDFNEIYRCQVNANVDISLWKYDNGEILIDIRQHRFKKPTRKGVRFPLEDFKSFLNINDINNLI